MRRNFAQVIKEGKIDLKREYSKFYHIFYESEFLDNWSMADFVAENFVTYPFRGTCLTLEEFDEMYGYDFEKEPSNFDEDYLINFMEYMYNFILYLSKDICFFGMSISFYIQQFHKVIDMMGYQLVDKNGIVTFIPRDNNANAVAESQLIPDNISYKVLEYNHHSLEGNIEAKREILIKLANILESHDKKLYEINHSFKSDLFYLLNNCNIRHNNQDKSSKYYNNYIAELSATEMEHTYDEIYQMCLLAFMQLEHAERKEWLVEVKDKLINT